MPKLVYLSAREAAARVGLSQVRICVLARTGRFPGAKKIGTAGWIIPESALSGLQTHGPGGRPPAPKNNPRKFRKGA